MPVQVPPAANPKSPEFPPEKDIPDKTTGEGAAFVSVKVCEALVVPLA
jgi:hypothetical protein